MKKRVLSLVLCGIMILSSVPVTPLADIFTIEAYAGDITELEKVYESVPDKSQWGNYIDTSLLEAYYKQAKNIIDWNWIRDYSQAEIDQATEDLRKAINNLVPHTQSISIDKSAVSVDVNKTVVLTAMLGPENAGDPVTWSSNNSACVSVEKTDTLEAVVTVKKYTPSKVTVTATSNGKTAVCHVTTLNPLSSVKLSGDSLTLFEDQSKALSASALGVDSSATPTGDVFYTWTSTNTAVASVDDKGVVTANAPGACTIKVTASDGDKISVSASCKVTVNKTVHITALTPTTTLVSETFYMVKGEKETFKLAIAPTDASFKDIEWKSSKPAVASVGDPAVSGSTATAKITALNEGRTRITYLATDGSGVTGSFVVEVQPQVSSLSFKESKKVLTLTTEEAKFTAVIAPEDAGNQVLTWTSSDEKVCTVDKNGVLYPKAKGVCTITATTTDGSGLTASGTLRVAAKAKSVTLDRESAALDGEETLQLKATVATSDGDKYTDVKWTSGDTKIATVDDNGVVTAKYPGEVVIKATALDGSEEYDTCVITVTQSVKGVAISPAETVSTGDSITLRPTITPSFASNQDVTWHSSDESVATVDPYGVVTGKTVGTAVITCTTADGGHTAECRVTVVISAQGVSLGRDTLTLWAGYKFQFNAVITPTSATNKEVAWASSDENVAVISETGLVTAVAGGSCYITATTVSGGFTAKCLLTVLQDASGVALDYSTRNMYLGQTTTLNATVLPETATNRKVAWSSSNSAVVTVTATGKLTALSKGTAIITVRTESGGYTATCAVTVGKKIPVTGMTLETNAMRIKKGDSVPLIATITPDNASEKGITWTSSDKSIATVSSSGVVKAVSTGEVIIKAVTKDGSFQQQCKVVVVQPVTSISLSSDSIKLAKGKTKTLKATVAPEDATDKDIIWTSSDENVATVSASGVITAKSQGYASISATAKDGSCSASCNVNVYVAVSGVRLAADRVTIPKGEKRILSATVLPSDAENTDVTWESSDTDVARVNEAGQVTARTKGTAKITVTTKDGGYTASCVIEVVQLATEVNLDFTNISINAGKTKTLVATVKPTTASDRTVTWKSSNTKVATVNSKGVVTAVAAGTANITATSADGNASTYCKVTVTQPPTGVSVSEKTLKVGIGKTKTLTATVKPSNASNKSVTWKSSNTKLATVSSSGVVKGIAAGTVKITATTMDGKYSATCTITVYTAVKSVKLNKTSLTLKYGNSTTITPTISPSNATYKTVKWTSSDNDVVTVDSKGKIKAVGVGYAVITATTTQGSKKATCQVNVVKPVTGVKLNKSSIRIEVGDKYTLKATISPSDASNKTLSWKTSDKSVATVSSSGVVTAKKLGKATVTVTAADGGYSAKCTVNVVKLVTGVKLNKSSSELYLGKTLTLKATVSPSDATTKTVKWTSSDTAVATVSSSGVVTPVKPGTAVITVKTSDGSFTAKCTVTVKRAVTKITLNKTSATLKSDTTLTLKPTISPSNATDKTVTWKSSNKKVATVTSSGVVKPVGKGTATITATSENGLKATCKVTVYMVVTGVEFNKSEADVYAGEKITLKASVLPSDANKQTVTFSSSDKNVATVSSKGVVTGVGVGTAVITVKTDEGAKTAQCKVTVKQHVTSISLDRSNITVVLGAEHKLNATVKPETATEKGYTFSSSDDKIVSVDEQGNIRALACGTVTITVTSKENDKKDTCKVTVIKPLEDIELITQEITVYNRKSSLIDYKVIPEDATDKEVVFSSEDENVAVVDENGLVTGVGKGTTYVSVKAANNDEVVKMCKVTVLQGADAIETDKDEYVLYENESLRINARVVPDNAENTAVYWSIEDESVALVDAQGNVRALKKGETIIKVTSNQNPEAFKEVKLTVKKAVTKLTLDSAEKTLYSGEDFTLAATLLPEDASDKTVVWQSSDEKVATVEGGKVTAVAGGEAVITAVSADNEKLTAQCKVTVRQLPLSVELAAESKTLNVGDKFSLAAKVMPENTYDKSVTYKSSDEKIATVDNQGNITALSIGEAVITATASDGKTFAECKVRVMILAEKVDLSLGELTLEKGKGKVLIASVLPENATEKQIVWTSSDEKVATVDENGKVMAVAGGTAIIRAASTTDGVFAECKVTVQVSSKTITLDSEKATLYSGEALTLKAEITPEDVTNKNIIWTSSDESVATVVDGVVTAKGRGTAKITAKTQDTGLEAACEVTVIKHVSSVTLPVSSATVYAGKTLTLTATVLPEDAENKKLIWKSSDEKVATVKDGKVTALRSGSAVITVKSEDGNNFAFCIVRVLQGINEIKLDKPDAVLDFKESVTLVPTLSPEIIDDNRIIWVSSDESVAKVIDGVVSAQEKSGTAIIKAVSASDEAVYAQCLITVREPVAEITLSETEFTMTVGDQKSVTATILPENANDKTVIWTSGDSTVATVEDGVITAVASGVVEITITSVRYGVSAKCRVTVNAAA